MKCPNCGGEVSVNDTECPYCHSPNSEGIHFQQQVQKKRRFNQYLREKTQEQMRLPVLKRTLNLAVFFLVLLFIVQLLFGLGFYLFAEENILAKFMRPDDWEEQMAVLYEEGAYGELDAFMEYYYIENTDYPVYTQMCLLDYSYQEFWQRILSCMQSMEQGYLPDDYDLESSLLAGSRVLDPYIPAYPDIYPENQEPLKILQQEVASCLSGMFFLTEDDIRTLSSDEENFSYKTVDQLCEQARLRLQEKGYRYEESD